MMEIALSGDSLTGLKLGYERVLALCDALEQIADSLPDRLNHQRCLHVARSVAPLMRDVHQLEESVFFPGLETLQRAGMAQTIERLRLEHYEDECFSEEVQYELLEIGRGAQNLTPEATGYMLRGFFDGLRRHVFQEQELLSALTVAAAPQLAQAV